MMIAFLIDATPPPQKISREFRFLLLIIMIAIPISIRPSKNITREPYSSTHHHDSCFDRRHASPSEKITRVPFSSTHHHDSHSYQHQAPEKYHREPFSSTHHHDSHFDRRHASPSENITRVPFSSTHHHDSHSYQRQAPEKYHESSIFINSLQLIIPDSCLVVEFY